MSSMLAPQLKALGFVRNPFPQTPDADCYFRTPIIEKQFAEVRHCLVTGKGFVLMTGEVGTGKSTFLRSLIDQLLEANCKLAYVFNSFLHGRDLLLAINRDFGLAPGLDMADDLERLNQFLIEANRRGQTCVVLIDDAQNFDMATLELVRLLSNLETRQRKLLQIVLAGQPELAQLLAQPAIRQLASRIVQHVQLTPLSVQDCERYIAFRLAGCLGDAEPVTLTAAAQRALYRHACGNPRKMHLILDRSLYGVVTQGQRSIDAPLIETAAGEAGLAPSGPGRQDRMTQTRAIRLAAHACAASLFVGCGVALTAWAVVDNQSARAASSGSASTAIAPLSAEPSRVDGSLPHPPYAPFALQAGAPRDAVLWLQMRLAATGFYQEALDGLPGPHTREALRRFRASHGHAAVPLLDGATLLLLDQVDAAVAMTVTTATETKAKKQ